LKDILQKHDVKLIGGGLDEAPFAYKDIDVVMQAQQNLVDVVGTFTPKIVRMCGDKPKTHMNRKRLKEDSVLEGE
jgi:tRNA-splicing ligase RtcB